MSKKGFIENFLGFGGKSKYISGVEGLERVDVMEVIRGVSRIKKVIKDY